MSIPKIEDKSIVEFYKSHHSTPYCDDNDNKFVFTCTCMYKSVPAHMVLTIHPSPHPVLCSHSNQNPKTVTDKN